MTLSSALRLLRSAGAGKAMSLPATLGERRAHVFVAVLGKSNYTYAEARWSKGLADWVGAHVNALAFLGRVPKLLVCDNLQSAFVQQSLGRADSNSPIN